MHYATEWQIDATVILTKREIATVLADLLRKAVRSRSTHMNLVIFRLVCCCGLRVSEIAGLRLADVRVGIDRPHYEGVCFTFRGHLQNVPIQCSVAALGFVDLH